MQLSPLSPGCSHGWKRLSCPEHARVSYPCNCVPVWLKLTVSRPLKLLINRCIRSCMTGPKRFEVLLRIATMGYSVTDPQARPWPINSELLPRNNNLNNKDNNKDSRLSCRINPTPPLAPCPYPRWFTNDILPLCKDFLVNCLSRKAVRYSRMQKFGRESEPAPHPRSRSR